LEEAQNQEAKGIEEDKREWGWNPEDWIPRPHHPFTYQNTKSGRSPKSIGLDI
jgi:hypothetical protein